MSPFVTTELPQLHISRFGVISKSTPGKWQLILDLSLAEGYSVNDGISETHCSFSYVSVDDTVEAVIKKGWGAQLTKVDIYRISENLRAAKFLRISQILANRKIFFREISQMWVWPVMHEAIRKFFFREISVNCHFAKK